MPQYSEDELVVLNHFFTNTDKPVYAVRDAMGSEIWGFLAGGASRSHLSVRDRFLQIWKDQAATSENPNQDVSLHYAVSMRKLATSIRAQDASGFDVAMRKASAFLGKWTSPNYGHNSLKDSCYDRIVVDTISIRSAKLLEATSLGAFQEKSTRYVSFKTRGFVCPVLNDTYNRVPDYRNRAADIYRLSLKTYEAVFDAATAYYGARITDAGFRSTKARENAIRAKAFDVARYCLLVSAPTSLCFTMPSRETERHLSGLLAHPSPEIQNLAEDMLDEAEKVNSGLLTHTKPNSFQYQTLNRDHKVFESLPVLTPHAIRLDNVAITASRDLVCEVAASILQEARPEVEYGYFFAGLRTMCSNTSAGIINDRLLARGPHDELPKCFNVGNICIDSVIDYGAFRDLQRHRVGHQSVSGLDTNMGFSIPNLLKQPELREVLAQYIDFQNTLAEFHEQIRAVDIHVAEFFFSLGNNVRFTYHGSLRDVWYILELRSKPSGHVSYREWSQSVYMCLRHLMPRTVCDLIRIDMQPDTDRRQEENNARN